MTINEIVLNQGIKKIKKIELLEQQHKILYNQISKFASNTNQILYCFKHEIYEQPTCQLTDCGNLVPFNKSNVLAKGCCLKHSQEITFLEIYGVSNPMKLDVFKEKIKTTSIEKFGVDNYSKTYEFKEFMSQNNPMYNLESIEKLKSTNLERFGVDNPMKHIVFSSKVSKWHKQHYNTYKNKVEQTNILNLGVVNPLMDKTIHKKTIETKRVNNYFNRISKFNNIKPEFSLDDYHGVDRYSWSCTTCGNTFGFTIEDGHIPICRKCNPLEKNTFSSAEKELVNYLKVFNLDVVENDRKILKGKELDIYIPSKNLAIEFNGIYWHSESKGKDKNYHLDKTIKCEEQGIQLIHVTDDDWKYRKNATMSLINSYLKIPINETNANLRVLEISLNTAKCWLLENSLIPLTTEHLFYGMFDNLTLVGILSLTKLDEYRNYSIGHFFIKSSFNSLINYDLLLNKFISAKSPDTISYIIDKRYFSSFIMTELKFKKQQDLNPSYEYYMGINDKIWNCGYYNFLWTREREIKEILLDKNYKKILKPLENEIIESIPFAETFEEALYAIKNDILEKPICQYPGCNNKIPHRHHGTGWGYYAIGCGEDHTKRLNNLQKYGVENVSQLKEIKDKKEITTMKNHGVKNPKQSPAIAAKIESTMNELYGGFGKKGILKDKIENTCLEKYGILNPMHVEEHRLSLVKTLFDKILERLQDVVKPNFTFEEYQGSQAKQEWICVPCGEIFPGNIAAGKTPRCPKCFPNQNKSYGEMDLFNSLDIPDKIQSDWSVLINRELDIYIPSKKLAIEYNGIWWHSEAQGKDKNYHLDKTLRCEEQGIQLIHIFESEWEFHQEIIKSIIASKLGNINNKISASKCTMKEVDILDKNNFLDENHLEGKVESSINLGLFYNDTLVFIMCFKLLKNNHFELIRYCSKLNTRVYGGLSKLLNIFKLNYFPKSIKCLIDRRFSFNHNLEKFDFRLKGILPPSHFFISNDKLIKPEDNLIGLKNKIWNCGYYNFLWTREKLNK